MALNDPVVAPPLTPESDEQWETRARFRDDLVDALRDELAKVGHDVVGGEDDGVFVVTRKQWQDAINAVAWSPIPPVSNHAAEVVTGASVTVWCVCPRCKIAGPILMSIEPELRVDTSSAELRLKAKAKPRTHMCGQLTLAVAAPEIEGQESLNLEEIIGPRCGKIIDLEADTVCHLPEGHDGDCAPAPAEEVLDAEPEDPGIVAPTAPPEPPAPRRSRSRRAPATPAASEPPATEDDDLLPGEMNLGACPWPSCELASEHPGQHQTAVDDRDEP